MWEQRKEGNVGLSLFYTLIPGLFQFIFSAMKLGFKKSFSQKADWMRKAIFP